MASTLGGYLLRTPHEVYHARDLGLHKKPDVEWIEHLSATGEDWLIISGDGRIRKNPAERTAYRRAKLKGVLLEHVAPDQIQDSHDALPVIPCL